MIIHTTINCKDVVIYLHPSPMKENGPMTFGYYVDWEGREGEQIKHDDPELIKLLVKLDEAELEV